MGVYLLNEWLPFSHLHDDTLTLNWCDWQRGLVCVCVCLIIESVAGSNNPWWQWLTSCTFLWHHLMWLGEVQGFTARAQSPPICLTVRLLFCHLSVTVQHTNRYKLTRTEWQYNHLHVCKHNTCTQWAQWHWHTSKDATWQHTGTQIQQGKSLLLSSIEIRFPSIRNKIISIFFRGILNIYNAYFLNHLITWSSLYDTIYIFILSESSPLVYTVAAFF